MAAVLDVLGTGRLHRYNLAEGEVVTEGWRLNNPVRAAPVAGASGDSGATSGSQAVAPAPPVTCEIPGVTIEAAKAAEDGSGDLVVRLAEVHGARVSGTITLGAPARSVQVCDLLEDELSAVDGRRDGTEAQLMGDTVVEVTLHPFKVLTLRFRS